MKVAHGTKKVENHWARPSKAGKVPPTRTKKFFMDSYVQSNSLVYQLLLTKLRVSKFFSYVLHNFFRLARMILLSACNFLFFYCMFLRGFVYPLGYLYEVPRCWLSQRTLRTEPNKRSMTSTAKRHIRSQADEIFCTKMHQRKRVRKWCETYSVYIHL